MKEYKIAINNQEFIIKQDYDGKFIKPDLIKEYEKVGSALKPSFEPIIVARKPLDGTCVDNVIKWGVGGINIDECRVEPTKEYLDSKGNENTKKSGSIYGFSNYDNLHIRANPNELGRFPANTILTYDDTDFEEVCGGFPDTKSQKTNSKLLDIRGNNYNNATKNLDIAYERGYNDSGSASRYFYNAKASRRDRDCDGAVKNIHPTCKPTSLMQYLIRLVTPKGGTVLDPFMGSGSTGKAVAYENKDRNANYNFIGIEKEKEYIDIADARIKYASREEQKEEVKEEQLSLFGGDENE